MHLFVVLFFNETFLIAGVGLVGIDSIIPPAAGKP